MYRQFCPDGLRSCLAAAWIRLGLVLLGFGTSLIARGELQWQEQRILLQPPAGATEALAEFEFVNRGTAPVQIIDVLSGCGCTVMALENNLVRPGEKGKLRAAYHAASKQGKQSVTIAVTTKEPEEHRYDLLLEVELKDFVILTPSLVSWKLGDEPKPRIFLVMLTDNYRFLGAESSTRDFSVEIAEKSGEAVQLRVVPRDTWAKRSALIRVKVAQDGQPPAEVVATVRIL